MDEIGVLTDRATLRRRLTAFTSCTHQLRMGVADLVASDAPLAELRQDGLTCESVVDLAGRRPGVALHAVSPRSHGSRLASDASGCSDPGLGFRRVHRARRTATARRVPGQNAGMPDPKVASPSNLHADPAPATWHRFTAAVSDSDDAPAATATYGADLPSEAELRLLGPIEGHRLLDLGCGSGRAAVTFARQGAKVIAVDPSPDRLAEARQLAEQESVRIELHQGDHAALAFLGADTVDAVFSALALAEVVDLNRVFRQVHRVLRPEAPIVFSLPHPAFAMLDPMADDPLRIVRAYDDPSLKHWTSTNGDTVDQPRTISEIFTGLTRTNFKVDTLLEPTAPATGRRSRWFTDVMRHVPATILIRARKQGT